jgi:hypothetical protein
MPLVDLIRQISEAAGGRLANALVDLIRQISEAAGGRLANAAGRLDSADF